MKSERKQTVWLIMATAVILAAAVAVLYGRIRKQNSDQVLRFGMMAGSYWDVPTGNCYEVIDAAIGRFEEKHPGVKVEYVSGILKEDYPEWLAEQIVLGTEPDVFMIPSGEFDTIASLGVLKNLDDLMERDSGFRSSDYYRGTYAYGNIRGAQYALPYETVPTLMFVNKSILEREGIPMPGKAWTWEDFLSVCRQITKDVDGDGTIDQYGCYDYGWKEAADANGAVLFDEIGRTSSFSDPKVEAAVRFVKELNSLNAGYMVTAKDFDRGNVAFRPFAFSEYRTYKPYPWRIKKYSDFEWDCTTMPSGPDGKGQTSLNTLLMGISSRSGKETLAWDFLKELCYSEATQSHLLKASQGMPVLRKMVDSDELYDILGEDTPGNSNMDAGVIRQVMEGAVAAPNFCLYQSAMELADVEISRMIQGNVTLDNGLLKLQREINSLLRQ